MLSPIHLSKPMNSSNIELVSPEFNENNIKELSNKKFLERSNK